MVGYDEPVPCVIFLEGEQFGVAALPRAALEILPQTLQPGFGILDGPKRGTAGSDSGIEIGRRPAPVGIEEPVPAIVRHWNRCDPNGTQPATVVRHPRHLCLIERREFQRSFYLQVAERIRGLYQEESQHNGSGTELVLVSRKEQVDDFVSEKYPFLRRSRNRAATGSLNAALAGRVAGSRADLGFGKDVESNGTAGEVAS